MTNDQGEYFCGGDAAHQRADGMDAVFAPCDFNNYYGARWFAKAEDGSRSFVELPDAPSSYQTAQIGNASVAWIAEKAAASATAPFFAYVGPHAPHYPATPAPWQCRTAAAI